MRFYRNATHPLFFLYYEILLLLKQPEVSVFCCTACVAGLLIDALVLKRCVLFFFPAGFLLLYFQSTFKAETLQRFFMTLRN